MAVERLDRRTHILAYNPELCPYSKATAGNVPTEVVVVKSLD